MAQNVPMVSRIMSLAEANLNCREGEDEHGNEKMFLTTLATCIGLLSISYQRAQVCSLGFGVLILMGR